MTLDNMTKLDKALGFFIFLCYLFCAAYLGYQDKYELMMLVLVVWYLQDINSKINLLRTKLDK